MMCDTKAVALVYVIFILVGFKDLLFLILFII